MTTSTRVGAETDETKVYYLPEEKAHSSTQPIAPPRKSRNNALLKDIPGNDHRIGALNYRLCSETCTQEQGGALKGLVVLSLK